MAEVVVRGASVLRDGGWGDGDLVVRDGLLVDTPGEDPTVVDASGLLAVPGFVDLQCNGGLGIDVTTEPGRLWELAAALPRYGVTAWLPTVITAPEGAIDAARAVLAEGPPSGWRGAVPLGLHLEGPFLAASHRGAHPSDLLRPPSLSAIAGWSPGAGVALVTLAPDLDGAGDVIDSLVERGVVVSAGHTPATAAQAAAALDRGVRSVTHLFNAMAPLHHREPGLAGVALTDERVHAGLIVDGIHVHPAVVAVALRVLGDRLLLVTDATAALGMPAGHHRLGGRTVAVDASGVRLPDGTLAGSTLSMDQAVRNLCAFTGAPPEVALRAASTSPARLLGDAARGTLRPGARGDIVLLTRALEVVATVVGGRLVHDAR